MTTADVKFTPDPDDDRYVFVGGTYGRQTPRPVREQLKSQLFRDVASWEQAREAWRVERHAAQRLWTMVRDLDLIPEWHAPAPTGGLLECSACHAPRRTTEGRYCWSCGQAAPLVGPPGSADSDPEPCPLCDTLAVPGRRHCPTSPDHSHGGDHCSECGAPTCRGRGPFRPPASLCAPPT